MRSWKSSVSNIFLKLTYSNMLVIPARARKGNGYTFLLVFIIAGFIFADSTDVAGLIVANIPDSSEFYINGLLQQPDENGRFTLQPGPLLLEIKQHRVVVYSALFSIDSSEQKTITFDCTSNCALLHVTTEPTGASLSLNGINLGTTPYLNRFVSPGSYPIMATFSGFIPVIRRIELVTDSFQIFSYQLEQTQALKDSLTAVRRAMRRKRQLIQSSMFGSIGIAMAVAGAYYDLQAYKFLENAQKASDAYDATKSPEVCQQEKQAYAKHRKNAERPLLYRNIFYSTAGLCIVGFYLSFVF